MIFGHRHSVSIGCLRTPTILEDDGLSFLAVHQFTEDYGHNPVGSPNFGEFTFHALG
jgi:hypothetical protein